MPRKKLLEHLFDLQGIPSQCPRRIPADASKVVIYGLMEPHAPIIRYVGCTKNLRVRIKNLLGPARRGDFFPNPSMQWVAQLCSFGQTPRVCVLEVCDVHDRQEREAFWIVNLRETQPLLNVWNGHDGTGVPLSRSTRLKISVAQKGVPDAPWSNERKANHHESMKQAWKTRRTNGWKPAPVSDETRRKLSLRRTGRTLSDETRRKIALAHIGMPFPESARKKLSEHQRGRKLSQETRRRMSEAQHKRHAMMKEGAQ